MVQVIGPFLYQLFACFAIITTRRKASHLRWLLHTFLHMSKPLALYISVYKHPNVRHRIHPQAQSDLQLLSISRSHMLSSSGFLSESPKHLPHTQTPSGGGLNSRNKMAIPPSRGKCFALHLITNNWSHLFAFDFALYSTYTITVLRRVVFEKETITTSANP